MNPALQQLAMDIMTDADLKARVLADPDAVLAERGITLPKGHAVRFVEDSPSLTHVVLPSLDATDAKAEALEQRTSKLVY